MIAKAAKWLTDPYGSDWRILAFVAVFAAFVAIFMVAAWAVWSVT